jgi:CRP-like cAMP-binding protein
MDEKNVVVSLDEDSLRRLERLKVLVPNGNEDAVFRLALKSLEQKVDKILRKRLAQRIRGLKKEGLSHQEIADYLNERNIPASRTGQRWRKSTVTRWLGETTRQSM